MQLVWQFRSTGMNPVHTTSAIADDGTVYLPFGEVAQPAQPQPTGPGGFLDALGPPSSGSTEPTVK